MNLVNASQAGDTRLSDYLNQMVAVRYRQDGPVIESTFDGQTVNSPTIEAEIWSFDGTNAASHGSTLVFPPVLRRNIKSVSPDFLTGWLRRKEHKGDSSRTVYTIEPLSDEDLTAFRLAVTS